MFSILKNHPFAIEAFFEKSIVLTFAIPKEDLESLIPECLELDTFNDKWAFVAMAMVQTKGLRPKGFPVLLGHDFFLVGFRIFVKYKTKDGKRLRGLFILKSETDKVKMEVLGNLFTHYNYSYTDISQKMAEQQLEIKSVKSDFSIVLDSSEREDIPLPVSSPFSDWKEARRFAGPLPFTFTYKKKKKEVLIIEGVRENWVPRPVTIKAFNISFLESMNLRDYRLANAFIINDISYSWKKGRIDAWQ